MFMFKRISLAILCLSLMVMSGHAAVTSYDYTFVNNDVFSADFSDRLNANFTKSLTGGINNINSANISDGTLAEIDMADEINPRIRTYEGASCEFVYSGLTIPTAGSLSGTIAAGTAYPRGYRVIKASGTAHSFGASTWTWVDLDSSGNFQYSQQSIGSATPAVASNSLRLARVSTDVSTILTVQDLRKTSCTNGPFSIISDATGEATLANVLSNGQYVRRYTAAGRTPVGLVHGFFVSYDTTSTFKVTSGVANINGLYRFVSADTTVPQTIAATSSGTSGADAVPLSASSRYYVYAAADQSASPAATFIYSLNATAPVGATNYRLIGSIPVDVNKNFTSTDVYTVHGISERELPFAWIRLDGSTGAPKIKNSFNIATVTENSTGNWTVTFNSNPNSVNYSAVGTCGSNGASTGAYAFVGGTIGVSSARFFCVNFSGSEVTAPDVFVQFIGDNRK